MMRNTRKAGLPRYLEIAAALRRQLASGRWQAGDRLPTIAEFAREFAVTPVTAREAVKLIESQGMVECRRGSGTYVSTPALSLHSLTLRPDLSSVGEQLRGVVPTRLAPPEDATRPEVPRGLKPAPRYHRLYRLVSRDGQPLMVADVWLDSRLYRRAPSRFENEVALTVLMDLPGSRSIRRWRQHLTVDVAGPELAAHLGRPPHAPVAEVHIALADPKGMAVYLGILIMPAELVRVEFDSREEAADVH